jgi:hypothetical protein
MINDNASFDKNGDETISFFSKKNVFFPFFRLFSEN